MRVPTARTKIAKQMLMEGRPLQHIIAVTGHHESRLYQMAAEIGAVAHRLPAQPKASPKGSMRVVAVPRKQGLQPFVVVPVRFVRSWGVQVGEIVDVQVDGDIITLRRKGEDVAGAFVNTKNAH